MKNIFNKRGAIFITIVLIATLMVLTGAMLSNMILQDTHMIKHLRYTTQAQLLAEAGLNDALATIVSLGFAAVNNPANFPQKNLGDGTYDVSVDTTSTAGRVLLTSVGSIGSVTRTTSVEIRDNTPTSLYFMMSAGSDLRIRSMFFSDIILNGNVHANNDARLRAQVFGNIEIHGCGSSCCDGSVTATGTATETETSGGTITRDGQLLSGQPLVTFPNFDYASYEALATASGDFYAGDATFGSLGTTTDLNPANGIIYVEGTAFIQGTVNLNGGLVASRIRVIGKLHQDSFGTRNVIIARGDNTVGDIEIFWQLETDPAIVFAARDFTVLGAGATIIVDGALIAARNLRVWDFITDITYNHSVIYPDGLLLGTSGTIVEVLNWSR